MSQSSKRLSILLDSEINELYSPPSLTPEQRRHYFSLNDIELDSFNRFKDRYSKLYFVMLLGYFNIMIVITGIILYLYGVIVDHLAHDSLSDVLPVQRLLFQQQDISQLPLPYTPLLAYGLRYQVLTVELQ